MKKLLSPNNIVSIIHTSMYAIVLPLCISIICLVFPKYTWSNETFHSVVECVGAIISFIVAFLLSSSSNSSLNGLSEKESFWIRMALLSMGFFDLMHAIVSPGNNFVWFHSLAVFSGGLFFSCVFLKMEVYKFQKKISSSAFFISIFVIFSSIFFSNSIPRMVENGNFTSIAASLNIFGSLGYLVAAIYFFNKALRESRETWIILSSHCALFCWSGLLFEFSSLWDVAWWWWHILRLAAYVVLIYFIYTPLRRFEQLNYAVFYNTAKELAEKDNDLKSCLLESIESVSQLSGFKHFYLSQFNDDQYGEIEDISLGSDSIPVNISHLEEFLIDRDTRTADIHNEGNFFKVDIVVLGKLNFTLIIRNEVTHSEAKIRLIKSFYEQFNNSLSSQSALKELKRLAHFDTLTTLPNRNYFNKALEQAIKKNTNNRKKFMLIYIDLDGFKKINDTFGHQTGDDYLQSFSTVLKERLFEIDFLARIGGDEFAVIAQSEEKKQFSNTLIQKLKNIDELRFSKEGNILKYNFSIGIASFPEAGTDIETLLRAADIAMYKSKSYKGSHVQFFTDELNVAYKERAKIEQDILSAIDDKDIYSEYQPIVDLDTGCITGFEALARWHHSDMGFIPPLKWISIAEDCDLIEDVGYKIIENSLHEINKIKKMHGLKISFNISTKQLLNNRILSLISKSYKKYPWLKGNLCFEITETQLVEDFEQAKRLIHDINNLDAEVHLDDFGIGFSSFNYLNEVKFSALKIPREFISQMQDRKNSLDIIRCIFSLAESMNMNLVVEGVELDSELKIISSMHKNKNKVLIQGYYYSKPMKSRDIEDFFESYHKTSK